MNEAKTQIVQLIADAMSGQTNRLELDQLFQILNTLGFCVEIKIHPAKEGEAGQIRVVVAE